MVVHGVTLHAHLDFDAVLDFLGNTWQNCAKVVDVFKQTHQPLANRPADMNNE